MKYLTHTAASLLKSPGIHFHTYMDLKQIILSGHAESDYLSLSYPLSSPGDIVQPILCQKGTMQKELCTEIFVKIFITFIDEN